jgi:triosephosphate isomerase
LAAIHDVDIFFTGQLIDLPEVMANTKRLIVTAQHMDFLRPGRGMGSVLPEALVEAGVQAVSLNHVEKPLRLDVLANTIERANEVGLITMVCADSVKEVSAVAQLKPDVIICEQTRLIGTGITTDEEYMAMTTRAIRSIDKEIKVVQAAGVKKGADVYRLINKGSDGTGSSSGIALSPEKNAILEEMILGLVMARDERRE